VSRRRLTRVEMRRRLSNIRVAIIAGLVAFMLLGTSGVAYALWSASAALTSTAGTATVTVSQALSASTLAKTYTSSDLVAVGVVTVTNIGTRSGDYSLAIAGTSTSTAFRSAVNVAIGTGTCTTTSALTAPVTGTMAATVTKTGTLAAGASVALCVRTSITAANVAANPGVSLSGTAASSITVGTWSANAATSIAFTQSIAAPTGFQSVQGNRYKIYQANVCIASNWDFNGIARGGVCENEQTSQWRLVDAPNGNKYVQRAHNTSTTLPERWSATSATAVTLNTPGDVAAARWTITARPDGTYRFISESQNRCLAVLANNSLALAVCSDASAAQGFTFELTANSSPAPVTLTCGGNNGTWNVYGWPVLTGYQQEVDYFVYIDGVYFAAQPNGYDPNAHLYTADMTAAQKTVGTHAVEVRQSVGGAPQTVTGTGIYKIAAGTGNMTCT